MIAALRLTIAHARHHPWRTVLASLCVCVAALLPIATRVLMSDFQARLLARARATPMIVGARGNRFDLTMSCLYFRQVNIPTITTGDSQRLSEMNLGVVIPFNTRFTARGAPLVACSADYFSFRQCDMHAGQLPVTVGEVVAGATVARQLGLAVGDTVFSDQRELYDITKPQALKLRVVGVLSFSQSPDDQALFTDIKTAWILEGLSHGHAQSANIPDQLILNRSGSSTAISEELVDDNQVTPENASRFHLHTDPDRLPLTGLIVVPPGEKEFTILKARVDASPTLQASVPKAVIEELLAQVVRLRWLIDAVAITIGVLTTILVSLIAALSLRLRAREAQTLQLLGASRATVVGILGGESLLILVLGAGLALAISAALAAFPPDLVKFV